MLPPDQPAAARPRAARGEGELLREQLLDAATGLVHEQGTAAKLSIRQVTKRAGVSPMALYLHFDTLADLVAELIEHGFIRFGQALTAAVASVPADDPAARLQAMGIAYLQFAREEPAIYSVIFGEEHERQHEAAGHHPEDSAGSAAFEFLVEAIEACQAAGAGRPGDPRQLSVGVWSSMHGFATLCEVHDDDKMPWPADEEFARQIYDAWIAPRG